MVGKIKTHLWLLGFVVSLCFSSLTTYAQSKPVDTKVVDDAHLMTAEEITEMEAYIQEIITYTEMDTIVVTSDDMQGLNSREYADQYYVNHKLGKGEGMSGVLILLNMEDREIYVYTRGYMREYLTDSRIDTILDHAYEYLSEDDYYMGITSALDDVTKFYEKGAPANAASYDVKTDSMVRHKALLWWEILAAAAISILLFGIIFFLVTRTYSMKITEDTYPFRENSKLKLHTKEDNFVKKVVTTRRIETSDHSDGSGGNSSYSSSNGGSHGGGGRSF